MISIKAWMRRMKFMKRWETMANYFVTLYNDSRNRRMYMSHLLEYIRKNAMFVGLLTIFVACMLCFGGYMMSQQIDDSSVVEPPINEDEPVKEAKITKFEGSYGHDASVHLSWSIQKNAQTLSSVKLFQGERQLGGEMKDLSAFAMAQSVYQFPSGECTFTLQVESDDGSVITKDVTVFISYVSGIDMNSEATQDGVLLKLSYAYDEKNPVDVPRVKFISGSNIPFTLAYQETKKTKSGSFIRAETVFKLDTTKLEQGSYPVTIRWIFDGANISKDFDITVEK